MKCMASDMYTDGTLENMIWEIFCELGEFKLDLEHDSFRVANSSKYDFANKTQMPLTFPLKSTIKDAVEAAYKQLGLDKE